MSNAFFISDLHLGHRTILKFAGNARYGETLAEHDAWLEGLWRATITKRDTVYVLGDVAFSTVSLASMETWPGHKILVMGNHDRFDLALYLRVFDRILPSPWPYKHRYWLSHCPIHPAELRGKTNIHGHVHNNTIPDGRYISVCVEAVAGMPRPLEQLVTRNRIAKYDGE